MSVFSDLCTVANLKPKPGESYEVFAERMHNKVNNLADDQWDALSREAQDWNNLVVSPFEQRAALIAEGKVEGSRWIEVPPMEGFEPAAEVEEEPPEGTRRKPGKAPMAKKAAAVPVKAKPISKARKAHTGNSKVAPSPPVATLDHALTASIIDTLDDRLIVVEAEVKALTQLLGAFGGSLAAWEMSGAVPQRKAKAAVNRTPKENGPVASSKKSASATPKFREGSVAFKIAEVLATHNMTTSELIKHFKVDETVDTSFRQRLVDMKRKGVIVSAGRGQPWQLTK